MKRFIEESKKMSLERHAENFFASTNNFALWANHDEALHSVVEDILKSGLLLTWPAFENLTEDLWELAVNEHPHGLSKVTIPDRQKLKGVDIETLQGHSFNLSKVMGTIRDCF